MNRLEVFNKVERHLLRQMKRATKPNGDCVYRAPDGLRCAVGCLIEKRHYTPELDNTEGDAVSAVEVNTGVHEALRKSGVTINKRTLGMLKELQVLHDTVDAEYWKGELVKIRRMFFR